jgi:hypothetical protein
MPEDKNETPAADSPKPRKSPKARLIDSLFRDFNKARKDLKALDPQQRVDGLCKISNALTDLFLSSGG